MHIQPTYILCHGFAVMSNKINNNRVRHQCSKSRVLEAHDLKYRLSYQSELFPMHFAIGLVIFICFSQRHQILNMDAPVNLLLLLAHVDVNHVLSTYK